MLTRRDFRNFDPEKFKFDMSMAPWGNIEAVDDDDVDNKVTIFENIHKEIIDKHAPLRTFRVTRPATPWLTEEIKDLRSEEHTSELQSLVNLVCRRLLEKTKQKNKNIAH